MFNDIGGMLNYIEILKQGEKEQIEIKKKNLNNKCEACKEKDIEIVYKHDNYSEDVFVDGEWKLRLNVNFFCIDCYRIVINTEQLPKSSMMKEIDDMVFNN